MEGNLPSGLPDQTSRGQAGRGLGEVLEPQPLEQTGPAAMAEAPAEVAAAAESGLPSSVQVAAAGAGARPEQGVAAEGVPPTQVAAEQGAAATDGVQPEQVQVQVAAMDIDSPVRAGPSFPVTGAVTEPVTATAMEGVSVEMEGLPGPLAMLVYTGRGWWCSCRDRGSHSHRALTGAECRPGNSCTGRTSAV